MATRIQDKHRGNEDRHQRWARIERADLCARSGERHAQGVSQRQAAKGLDVPRSTLQAWRAYHDRLDACPAGVAFCPRVPGLAFLPQCVIALHVVGVEIGACGMRLGCLVLQLTGRNRCVAASYGTPPQVTRHGEAARVADRQEESPRLAHALPPKAMALTREATCTGGRCRVGLDPARNAIVVEPPAPAHDQDTWHELMAPALAGLTCKGRHATRDAAPGLLASGAHPLGAHLAPALCHGQPELHKAVSAPRATKQRAQRILQQSVSAFVDAALDQHRHRI